MALTRGSDALLKRLNQPGEITMEALRHLVDSAGSASARILSWEIYGKPAFERLRASFAVGPDRLPAFIEKLVKTKTKFPWEIFPEGTPPDIDQYRVVVKGGGGL